MEQYPSMPFLLWITDPFRQTLAVLEQCCAFALLENQVLQYAAEIPCASLGMPEDSSRSHEFYAGFLKNILGGFRAEYPSSDVSQEPRAVCPELKEQIPQVCAFGRHSGSKRGRKIRISGSSIEPTGNFSAGRRVSPSSCLSRLSESRLALGSRDAAADPGLLPGEQPAAAGSRRAQAPQSTL